jgi:hypothetical protein
MTRKTGSLLCPNRKSEGWNGSNQILNRAKKLNGTQNDIDTW